MPANDVALKCESCQGEFFVHNLKIGRLDSTFSFLAAGPGQDPSIMGSQFAAYLCLGCSSIWPYKRNYGGSPALQNLYLKIHAMCKAHNERVKDLPSLLDKAKSFLQAKEVMSSLPGGMPTEDAISSLLGPIRAQLERHDKELQRRKGGRPKGSGKKD